MAEVFKAKSYGVEGFEKLLVIKRILSMYSDNEEFVEMFVNEAKIAVSLNHANIVQIYDLGKAGDSYFMAMEYVQGMDLADVIDWGNETGKPFPLEAAIHIICEVAKGLDYAHRKKDQDLNPLNIIHRDVSPQNILISTEGEVKITDFGVARALNVLEDDTHSPVRGKYAYMAPEQAIAAPHDKRVDIFSAGVVFYELLTGANPLKDRSPVENLKLINDKSFPDYQVPCCGTLESIPVDLEPILRKALAPDPNDRYESAAELYEALLTFAYVEGLRAGASSLAEYIAPLVSERERNSDSSQLTSIAPRASRISSIHESSGRSTSVQRPSDADMAQFEDKNAIQLSVGIREVALLAYSWESKSFDSRKLEKIAESFGAILLEKEETSMVFGFGVQVPSAALVTAAKAALSVTAAMSDDNAFKAAGVFGAGIHQAELAVEFNAQIKLNSAYKVAIEDSLALSRIPSDAILYRSLIHPLLNRWYDCEIYPNDEYTDLFQLVKPRADSPALTKLIGRREEFRKIGDLLAGVSEGKGHILALTGPVGVGKTRILQEVKQRLTAAGHKVSWFDTRCLPWQRKKSFSTLQSLLRNIADINDDETPEGIQAQIDLMEIYGLPSHELTLVRKFITTGLVENTHVLKSAFIRIIRRSARTSMTIVAIDNLTAVDDESLDIIHALSHSISDVPVLLIVSIRLGYIHGFEGSPIFTQCDVEPLCENEMEQLIQSCIPMPSERLIRDILAVSASIPRFAEETIMELQRRGALKTAQNESIYLPQELSCPPTVRDLVASELFALPWDRRKIVQLAGCLREKIEVEILALLMNREPADLIPILQMLVKVKLLSQLDESTFAFPSPYIQQTAYQSIARTDRQLIHKTLAQRLEQEYPKDLEKYAEPLAIHYLKCGEKRAAFEYLVIAAQNAAVTLDNETSVRYYLLAFELAMAGIGNISSFDIFEQLVVMAPQTSQANQVLKQAILLRSELQATSTDEKPATGNQNTLAAQEATLLAHVGEYNEAVEQLQEVISRQDGAESLLSKRTLAEILLNLGNIAEATRLLEEIVDESSRELHPFANAFLTVCLALKGETDKALERIEVHSPSTTIAPISIHYLTAEGHCHFMMRKYELALEAFGTALTFAHQQNMKRELAILHHLMATCCLEQKNYRQAFDHLRESIEISTIIQFKSLKDRTQIGLWFIDAVKFGNQTALAQLEARDTDSLDVESRIVTGYVLGNIYLSLNRPDDARTSLQSAKALIREYHNEFYKNQINTLLSTI